MKENNEDVNINNLNNDILDLYDKYKDLLPTYEITHAMIMHAVSANLYCAPSGELLGIRTTFESLKSGIAQYEKSFS